jgi:hypothetical protein
MCRSAPEQARPDGGCWCPRPPRTAPDYSTMVPECDAELRGAGGPDVSRRESLGLLRPDLPKTNLEHSA